PRGLRGARGGGAGGRLRRRPRRARPAPAPAPRGAPGRALDGPPRLAGGQGAPRMALFRGAAALFSGGGLAGRDLQPASGFLGGGLKKGTRDIRDRRDARDISNKKPCRTP